MREAVDGNRISTEAIRAYGALLRETDTMRNEVEIGGRFLSPAQRGDPRLVLTAADRGRISAPVRFVWGEADPYAGPEVARDFAAAFQDAAEGPIERVAIINRGIDIGGRRALDWKHSDIRGPRTLAPGLGIARMDEQSPLPGFEPSEVTEGGQLAPDRDESALQGILRDRWAWVVSGLKTIGEGSGNPMTRLWTRLPNRRYPKCRFP